MGSGGKPTRTVRSPSSARSLRTPGSRPRSGAAWSTATSQRRAIACAPSRTNTPSTGSEADGYHVASTMHRRRSGAEAVMLWSSDGRQPHRLAAPRRAGLAGVGACASVRGRHGARRRRRDRPGQGARLGRLAAGAAHRGRWHRRPRRPRPRARALRGDRRARRGADRRRQGRAGAGRRDSPRRDARGAGDGTLRPRAGPYHHGRVRLRTAGPERDLDRRGDRPPPRVRVPGHHRLSGALRPVVQRLRRLAAPGARRPAGLRGHRGAGRRARDARAGRPHPRARDAPTTAAAAPRASSRTRTSSARSWCRRWSFCSRRCSPPPAVRPPRGQARRARDPDRRRARVLLARGVAQPRARRRRAARRPRDAPWRREGRPRPAARGRAAGLRGLRLPDAERIGRLPARTRGAAHL